MNTEEANEFQQKYIELRVSVKEFFELCGDLVFRIADRPIASSLQEEIWTKVAELKELVCDQDDPTKTMYPRKSEKAR